MPLFSLAVYVLFFTLQGSFDQATLLVVLIGSLLGTVLILFANPGSVDPYRSCWQGARGV